MRITKYLAAAALATTFAAANAQEAEVTVENNNGFSVNADFVSAYAWRGGYCAGASIQPAITYTIGGFEFGTWATTTLNGGAEYTEMDWSVFYNVSGLSVGVIDYAWTMDEEFVYFAPYKQSHFLEASVGYDLSENTDLPLSFSVNTMLAGANRKFDYDVKNEDDKEGKNAFSTYINAIYAPSLKNGLDLSLEVGFAVEAKDDSKDFFFAPMYSSKGGFQCVNIDLGLSKSFNIKDKATLTLQAHTYCNPKGFEGHGEVGAMAGVGVSF